MGVVRKVYNFVMGLIGLIVLGLFAYVFILVKWEEHKEEQRAKARAEVAEEVAETARERGLGDLEQLQQEYFATCSGSNMKVIEGGVEDVCSAVADALVIRSQERGMSLFDQVDLDLELCALDAKEYGDDPDQYCLREEYMHDALRDAMAVGLCRVDSAWLFDEYYGGSITKRGPDVYRDGDLHVECATGRLYEWDYEGFFEGMTGDEEWPQVAEQVYYALDEYDLDRVRALLDGHEFGEDEFTDLSLLNQFLYEPHDALLPEFLERNGGTVNYVVRYYNQPLAEAIDNGSASAALVLLSAGADPVRPYDDFGKTPIVRAASRGMLEVVKALVESGADVDGVVGSESLSFGEPLLWAAWHGHDDVALWLLENGAKVAPDDPSQYRNWEPHMLLDYAVAGASAEVIGVLIERGATSNDMKRLFESACAGGSPEVLELLFAEGYELPEVKFHDRIYDNVVDVIQEEDGKGPIENGVAAFELLLEHGLDLSDLRESGWNYAHQAVVHYAPATLQLGDDRARDAIVREYRLRFVKRVIDEVLASGIDIDQRYESRTMLMEAADGGQPELTTYLLELGADATLTDDKNQTALDIAVAEGRRLTAFWDERENVRARFGDTIEVLGGSREALNQTADENVGR